MSELRLQVSSILFSKTIFSLNDDLRYHLPHRIVGGELERMASISFQIDDLLIGENEIPLGWLQIWESLGPKDPFQRGLYRSIYVPKEFLHEDTG